MTTAKKRTEGRRQGDEGRSGEKAPDVSVIVPMLNEQDNVVPLYQEIREALDSAGLNWEAVFVDDGSRDLTVPRLLEAAAGDPRVTLVRLTRRFGQTAALDAGFGRAVGRHVVSLDADLQNDPRDIPKMLQALDEPPGADVVTGWRRRRADPFWTRRLPSMIANKLLARLTWTRIHDFGCTLRAYRRDVLEGINLYGEMHRFIPAICTWKGARVTERVVNHRPRVHGTSKYGLRRTVKVLLDLMTVKFLGDYLTKPIYFFGKLAIASILFSFFVLAIGVCQKFGYLYPGPEGLNLNRNVLVLLAMLTFHIAVMFLVLGILAELMVRIYHESQGRKPYSIREVLRPEGDRALDAEDEDGCAVSASSGAFEATGRGT